MPSAHEFLTTLAIVLCVAAVTTVVFQRLRQPVVLGYILAGLIVGPNVPIPLVADPLARGGGLVALSRVLVLHPVLVLLALRRHGFDPGVIPDDPADLAESLRDLGYAAEVPLADQPTGPSFAIDDDACPRRRHARRVLRRLLQKGKIGGHHTEIGHFTRGLPDHEKSDAAVQED